MLKFHLFVTLIGVISGASEGCKNTTSTQLQKQWAEYMKEHSQEGHESYFAMELFRNTISSELAKGRVGTDEIPVYGNQDSSHCELTHIQGQDSLQDRSYCPWYNVINHSPQRYPADIAEARCRCLYGAGIGVTTACEEVHYNIRVLRRTSNCDENGYYIYSHGWQSVSVGCTITKVI